MSNIIWNRGIEGVVIAPLMERLSSSAPRTIELEWNRFASVEISETITSPELHRSLHDQYTSMVRLLDELVKLDYATMSGIDQNSRRVGAAAIDMLVAAIHRGQRGVPAKPVHTEVEGGWKPGTSTCRQPGARESFT